MSIETVKGCNGSGILPTRGEVLGALIELGFPADWSEEVVDRSYYGLRQAHEAAKQKAKNG